MKLHLTTALALTLASQATAADLRMSWWGGESRHVATQEALRSAARNMATRSRRNSPASTAISRS